VRADGTDRIDLTGGADDVSPAWSPDGERIVFTRADFGGAGGHLMTIPAGGGAPVDLTTPSAVHTDRQSDWQPILEPAPRPPRPPRPHAAPAPTPVPIAPSFTG
jgi:Tol biopolymer transport system component